MVGTYIVYLPGRARSSAPHCVPQSCLYHWTVQLAVGHIRRASLTSCAVVICFGGPVLNYGWITMP